MNACYSCDWATVQMPLSQPQAINVKALRLAASCSLLGKGHSRNEDGKYEPLLLVERAGLPWNRKNGRFYYSRFDRGTFQCTQQSTALKIVVSVLHNARFNSRNCTCCSCFCVFVRISEQTAVIAPNTINWFVFITEMMRIEFVYWNWRHGLDCSGIG